MPIRFRCAFCNQLMGIARRKAGSVVRCPKCSGQVVVPIPEPELAAQAPQPKPANVPVVNVPEVKAPDPGLFDQDDFSQLLRHDEPPPLVPAPPPPPANRPALPPVGLGAQDYDVEPVGGPIELRGIFLTPGLLTLAGVLIIVLMGAAFFVGWIVGRS